MKEVDLQRALLFSDVGAPNSGYARYAAAVFFYNEKQLSGEMLEIYRRCCKFDRDDPIELAKFEGLTGFPMDCE